MSFNPRLIIFGFVSLITTAYILLSAYAVIFVQPLPFINAIALAQSTDLITTIAKNDGATISYAIPEGTNQSSQNLQLLKIPKNETRLNLTKGIVKDDQWFAKPDDGHYLLLLSKKTGKLLDILIYANKNWRTITNPESLLVGDNMFIQTDTSYQYLFRITDKKTISLTDSYVPESSSKLGLIFILEDEKGQLAYIFRGRLLDSLEAN